MSEKMENSGTFSDNFFNLYELEKNYKAKTGSFSTCKKCYDKKSRKEYAVKIIKEKDNNEEEIDFLKRSQGHSNIVDFIGAFAVKDKIYFVMELLSGGDLFDVINEPFPEEKAKKIMKQLSSAVQFLHSKEIVHRDLKPENVIFAHSGMDAPAKIIDFGLSQNIKDCDAMKYKFFSLPYAAPEIVALEKYKESCDLWSLGALLYFILTVEEAFPYSSSAYSALDIKSGNKKYDEDIIHHVSDNCKMVIKGLLVPEPIKRLTANELVKHTWLTTKN